MQEGIMYNVKNRQGFGDFILNTWQIVCKVVHAQEGAHTTELKTMPFKKLEADLA